MKENIQGSLKVVIKILSRRYVFLRYFFVGFCILIVPLYARAQVFITEIMYDIEGTDTGREWIEVQNTGSTTVDLSTWKLFEANTNHKITAVGDFSLLSQGFAIIADNADKFKIDNPAYSGLLFDSTYSLGNEGETLILRDSTLADSDAVTYSPAVGGQGDGTTLQKSATGWIAALPTVGTQTTATESFHPSVETGGSGGGSGNSTESASGNSATGTAATDSQAGTDLTEVGDASGTTESVSAIPSTHSSQSVATISRDIEDLQVTSGRSRLGFVGAPLTFEAKIKVAKHIPINQTGEYPVGTWSMGDGTEYTGQSISHTYLFPGDYIVILNATYAGITAVSKTKVKIVEPEVSLDFDLSGYTKISNLSNVELNVGGWILESESSRFLIPKDTLIAKHSFIKLAGRVTHIPFFKNHLLLANPSGFTVAEVAPGSVTFKGLPADTALLVRMFEQISYQNK